MDKGLKKKIKSLKNKDELLAKNINSKFDQWLSDLPLNNLSHNELINISKDFSEKYIKAYRIFSDYTLLEKVYSFLETADITSAEDLLQSRKLYINSLEYEVDTFVKKLKKVEKDENLEYMLVYADIADSYKYEDLSEHYDLLRLRIIERKQEKVIVDKLKVKLDEVNEHVEAKRYQKAKELIKRINDIIVDAKLKLTNIATVNLNSISAHCLSFETKIKRCEKMDKINVKGLILKEKFNEALIEYNQIEWEEDMSDLGDLVFELANCFVQGPERYVLYTDIAKEYQFDGIASVFKRKYERLINKQMKKTI